MSKRKLPEIEIHKGNEADLEGLMFVANSFFEYGGTDASEYCEDTFRHSAEFYLSGNYGADVFIATHNERVIGYYAISTSAIYSKRPMVYEAHFAVLPEYVASHAGRKLTKAVTDYAKSVNARAVYGGATSGIERFDNSIINMYAKCGFVSSGKIMRFDCG